LYEELSTNSIHILSLTRQAQELRQNQRGRRNSWWD